MSFVLVLKLIPVIDQSPRLASGCTSGSISIWDLEKKKLLVILNSAHTGRYSFAEIQMRFVNSLQSYHSNLSEGRTSIGQCRSR